MIKLFLKIIFIIVSVFNIDSSNQYLSKSYIDNDQVYVYQNYCNMVDNCHTIYKIDIIDNNTILKQYYNPDFFLKDRIQQDFKDIDLDRIML